MFVDLIDSTGKIQLYLKRDNLQEPGEPEGYYNTVVKKLLDIGDSSASRARSSARRWARCRSRPTNSSCSRRASGRSRSRRRSDGETLQRGHRQGIPLPPALRRPRGEPRGARGLPAAGAADRRRSAGFLDERGYVEVETPALQPLYGGAAARPFTTHHNALDMPLFLRIADELYLKRLIVGGFEGVYEIAKDFRNEGLSRFHNPEFTMLELYVAYKDYEWMMDLVEEMIAGVATALHGQPEVQAGETTISFARPFERVPLFDAIAERDGPRPLPERPRRGRRRREVARHRGGRLDGHGQADRRDLRRARRAAPHPADVHHRLPRRALAAREAPPRQARADGALRADLQRQGALQRVLRAERPARPARALRGAGPPRAGRRRRGRPRRSTRTTSARSNTACRRRPASASASTGSRC